MRRVTRPLEIFPGYERNLTDANIFCGKDADCIARTNTNNILYAMIEKWGAMFINGTHTKYHADFDIQSHPQGNCPSIYGSYIITQEIEVMKDIYDNKATGMDDVSPVLVTEK